MCIILYIFLKGTNKNKLKSGTGTTSRKCIYANQGFSAVNDKVHDEKIPHPGCPKFKSQRLLPEKNFTLRIRSEEYLKIANRHGTLGVPELLKGIIAKMALLVTSHVTRIVQQKYLHLVRFNLENVYRDTRSRRTSTISHSFGLIFFPPEKIRPFLKFTTFLHLVRGTRHLAGVGGGREAVRSFSLSLIPI